MKEETSCSVPKAHYALYDTSQFNKTITCFLYSLRVIGGKNKDGTRLKTKIFRQEKLITYLPKCELKIQINSNSRLDTLTTSPSIPALQNPEV